MKKGQILRSVIAIVVMGAVVFGAIQYSEKLNAEKAALIKAQQQAIARQHLDVEVRYEEVVRKLEEIERQRQEEEEKRKAEEAAAALPPTFVEASVYYPDTTPAEIQELFDYYRSNYSNVVGYIYSPYTVINYPILRGTQVNDFYLSHDINGNADINGCIVLEPLNSSNFSDDNTILYGHNMRSGAMFASLCNYKSSSYFSNHPYMYILTPTQNYRLDLWAGIICPHDDPVFATGHDSANRQSFYRRSTFTTSLGAPEGRMVTLCTCSYEANNYRYCVLGKLVEIN